MSDDLSKRRVEEALSVLRGSFEAAKARGDAGYYVRPELGWTLLEAAEAGAKLVDTMEKIASCRCMTNLEDCPCVTCEARRALGRK